MDPVFNKNHPGRRRDVYLLSRGSELRLNNEGIVLYADGKKISRFLILQTGFLHLMGDIRYTRPLLLKLLEEGIDLVFYSEKGNYLGRLAGKGSRGVRYRLAQYRLQSDPAARLELASGYIRAKLAGQQRLLENFLSNNANHPQKARIKAAVKQLQTLHAKISRVRSIEKLLGYEGRAAAEYFAVFGLLVKPPFQFDKRNRRPPRDPVNSMLSYLYTVVTGRLDNLVRGHGFEGQLGFYHRLEGSRPALALDILEPLRPELDRIVLRLCNRRQVQPEEFELSAENGCRISADVRYLLLKEVQALFGTVTVPDSLAHRICNDLQQLRCYLRERYQGEIG